MARPKKAPRVRLQITLKKSTAKDLRKFAKRLDRDISEVVDAAVSYVMQRYKDVPFNGVVVEFPQPNPPR